MKNITGLRGITTMKKTINLTNSSVITVVNTKTLKVKAYVIHHPEQINEYERTLEEDERMFVNDLDKNVNNDE